MKGRDIAVLLSVAFIAIGAVIVSANSAFSYVDEGESLPRMTLSRHPQGKASYLGDGDLVSVFAFVKPGHKRSRELLDRIRTLTDSYENRPVQWTLIVSDRSPSDSLAAIAAACPLATILIDKEDRLYGAVGVPLVPVIGIADSSGQLLTYLPYRKVDYTRHIEARLKLALGDIDAEGYAKMMESSGRLQDSDKAKSLRHLKIATMLLKAGKSEKARLQVEDALALDPDSYHAYGLLAEVLDAMSEPEAAASARARADSMSQRHQVPQ